MAVVIETTLGDITVDLYLEQRPATCLNFLKLCKMKYYNYNLFHTIRSGFIAQTGDPTGEGSGGQSIWGILQGPDKRFFSGEKMPKIRHTDAGLLSMVCTGDMMVGSQFFFTLSSDLDSLDGTHCVIGEVTEGHDVLRKLNDVICDETHRPYRDVRITHTVVLEDPYSDPPAFRAPSRSPSPSAERLKGGRIAPDEEIDETQGKSAAEVQEMIEEKEAKARATILEIVGDLPDADIAPPENVLFVCKLNPVTTDDDLEIIFSRFGKIVSCEVIRDKKTGDSLQYAFIEFSDKKSCEEAYFKMDNVLIDDRRIHVDFSQSVSKIQWLGKGRGVKHINNDGPKNSHIREDKSKRSKSIDRERDYKNSHHNRDKNNDRRHRNHTDSNDKYERRHRSEKHSRNENKPIRERSRSGSKLDTSKDRNHQSPSKHRERNCDKLNNDTKHNSHRQNNNKRRNSSSSKSTSHSHNDDSKRKGYKENNGRDRNSVKEVQDRSSVKEMERNKTDNKLKRKHNEENSNERHKRTNNQKTEPQTPSPVSECTKKDKAKEKKPQKKHRSIKKKRKPSTSSSDSESTDSSSSDSSSSSDGRKKKKSRRKKKKYSSSSSSSSSSDSSSSSSSTSSDSSSDTSTSSDSETNVKKKHKTQRKRKITKKPKSK